MLRHIN